MDNLVKIIGNVLFPFMLVFGFYVAFHGHLSPGGGFPGGVIIATGIAILVIGNGAAAIKRRFRDGVSSAVKTVSGILLISIIILGLFFRDRLLSTQVFFELWSGGFTLLLNLAGGIMVAAGLGLIVFVMTEDAE